MSGIEHRDKSPKHLNVAVITMSDSRAAAFEEGKDEDISGQIVERKLKEAGHSSTRVVITDDADQIKEEISKAIATEGVDIVITTGGTGVTSRDNTVSVAKSLFDFELPGFGEVLRMKGYEMVGGAAMLTRATAGMIDRKPVLCLPGAPNSVEVAMDLILPELGHLVKHARE